MLKRAAWLLLLLVLLFAAAFVYVSTNVRRPGTASRSDHGRERESVAEKSGALGVPATPVTEARTASATTTDETSSRQGEQRPKQPRRATKVEVAPTRRPDEHVAVGRKAKQSRWHLPGRCLEHSALAARQRYFSEFEVITDELEFGGKGKLNVDLRLAPDVPTNGEEAIVFALFDVAKSILPEEFTAPTVFLYGDAEEMRRYACVASTALSYYDGAVHVVWLGNLRELRKSLAHEYAHHLLTELGVERPVWLHEGFAQYFAHEGLNPDGQRESPLSPERMTEFLSVDSSPDELEGFYYQAFMMWMFLAQLKGKRDLALAKLLAHRVVEGYDTPEELFFRAATDYGGNIFDGDVEEIWGTYYKTRQFPEHVLLQMRGIKK